MNFFEQLVFIHKIKKSWKESKKLINNNQGLAEEMRAIYQDAKNLLNRIKLALPPFEGIIQQLLQILKNVFK